MYNDDLRKYSMNSKKIEEKYYKEKRFDLFRVYDSSDEKIYFEFIQDNKSSIDFENNYYYITYFSAPFNKTNRDKKEEHYFKAYINEIKKETNMVSKQYSCNIKFSSMLMCYTGHVILPDGTSLPIENFTKNYSHITDIDLSLMRDNNMNQYTVGYLKLHYPEIYKRFYHSLDVSRDDELLYIFHYNEKTIIVPAMEMLSYFYCYSNFTSKSYFVNHILKHGKRIRTYADNKKSEINEEGQNVMKLVYSHRFPQDEKSNLVYFLFSNENQQDLYNNISIQYKNTGKIYSPLTEDNILVNARGFQYGNCYLINKIFDSDKFKKFDNSILYDVHPRSLILRQPKESMEIKNKNKKDFNTEEGTITHKSSPSSKNITRTQPESTKKLYKERKKQRKRSSFSIDIHNTSILQEQIQKERVKYIIEDGGTGVFSTGETSSINNNSILIPIDDKTIITVNEKEHPDIQSKIVKLKNELKELGCTLLNSKTGYYFDVLDECTESSYQSEGYSYYNKVDNDNIEVILRKYHIYEYEYIDELNIYKFFYFDVDGKKNQINEVHYKYLLLLKVNGDIEDVYEGYVKEMILEQLKNGNRDWFTSNNYGMNKYEQYYLLRHAKDAKKTAKTMIGVVLYNENYKDFVNSKYQIL